MSCTSSFTQIVINKAKTGSPQLETCFLMVSSDPYEDEIVPADWEALFGDDNDEAPQTMKIDVLIDVNI